MCSVVHVYLISAVKFIRADDFTTLHILAYNSTWLDNRKATAYDKHIYFFKQI